jgi:hypothetical protein
MVKRSCYTYYYKSRTIPFILFIKQYICLLTYHVINEGTFSRRSSAREIPHDTR